MSSKNLKLFLLVNTLTWVLLLIGWWIGSLFGNTGWLVGAMIGGVLGIFVAVGLAGYLGFLEGASFNTATRFSWCGLGVAAIVASMNEGKWVIQVSGFLLVGLGALLGKWVDFLFEPKSDPPPSILK